jgi:hypothetical protein
MGQVGNPHIEEAGENTRWKPGQSGNPSGPKPGYKHINTWVQQLLNDESFEAQIMEGYTIKEFKGAPLKAIILAQIKKAVAGDTKAYDSLVKSGWAHKTETDIRVKELPKPLLGGLDGVSSNDSDQEAS